MSLLCVQVSILFVSIMMDAHNKEKQKKKGIVVKESA